MRQFHVMNLAEFLNAETLEKIADHGKVTVEWLLYGDKIKVLAQVRDQVLSMALAPDTLPELKDSVLHSLYEVAITLREQLDLAGVENENLWKRLAEAGESITLESPTRPSPLSEPGLFGGIDTLALTRILDQVEELLRKRQKPLKSSKHAFLIALLYDEFQKTGQPLTQATLKEFLRRVE